MSLGVSYASRVSRYMQPALEIKGMAKTAIVGEPSMLTEHAYSGLNKLAEALV